MYSNKQYKPEVFHRNSFDDELKKDKRRMIIFGAVAILVILTLFVRGCYLEKKLFSEKIEGILQDKRLGRPRVSFSIQVYSNITKLATEYGCSNPRSQENIPMFEKMKIGDSVYKSQNSGMMSFYRKEHGVYQFIDSFVVTRWNY